MIKKKSSKTHHFRENISKYIILHHNQKIIKRIAEYLRNVVKIENKNYFMLKGEYGKKEITMIATGMGACNTAITVDQIISQGAKYIFKFGTFGALQDNIQIGDMYMPVGAVRSEGLTDAYAPIYYPAVADMDLYLKTLEISKSLGIGVKPEGIIHSVNIYSPYYEQTFAPNKYSPETYRNLGAIGVEMETSTAFVCSSVKAAKCVSILICNRDWQTQKSYKDGKKADWDKHQQEKRKDDATLNGIKLMLETIKDL